MEDPRIRKFAKFLIRSAVGLEKGEKILIELHGSETGLMKALVQEAYAAGGTPFIHIFDYTVAGALVQGASLPQATRSAVDFVKLCAERTAAQGLPMREGVDFEPLLGTLTAWSGRRQAT